MDDLPDNCPPNSSIEPTASSDLVGVCDDCCIDGSLMSPGGCNVASTCMDHSVGGEHSDCGDDCMPKVDDKCDDACRNITDTDDSDSLPVLDSVEPHADVVRDSFASVHVQSPNNGSANVSAAEKMNCGDEENRSNEETTQDAAGVDEPVISAIDVYGGLHLADSWHPVTVQRRREFGVGRVAPAQFTCKASGSLSLVRRLQLYSKLDGHTGCVNALHFNDAGNSVHLSSTMHGAASEIKTYRLLIIKQNCATQLFTSFWFLLFTAINMHF